MNYKFESIMESARADIDRLTDFLGCSPSADAAVLGGFESREKKGSLAGLYVDEQLTAFLIKIPYEEKETSRLKQIHYDNGQKPAWKGEKGYWRCDLALLPHIAFAFPLLEVSEKLLAQLPWITSLQREGFKAAKALPGWWKEYGLKLTGTAPIYENEGPQELRKIVFAMGLKGVSL